MFLSQSRVALFLAAMANLTTLSEAFCLPGRPVVPSPFSTRLGMSSTDTPIEEMRAGAIKQELESYGISTVSFLEKKELVEALTKARADGLQPKKQTTTTTTTATSGSDSATDSSTSTTSSESTSSSDSRPREERLQEEMEKCSKLKAGELKKELQERGISTTTFLEKSEFVQALAQARVDGVSKAESSSSNNEEGYAEYSNVEVLTDDSAGPRPKGGNQPKEQASNPFGGAAGANPFGGAAGASPFGGAGGNPMGGMGGMGGIADMLKNMGMGGAAAGGGGAANPFGGAGGNPFGGGGGANPFGGAGGMDAMAKAQQMMSNPKVQAIMAKAQSNPSIMKKVNECMSNPAAFAKYQNDPDVADLIKELQQYM